MESSGRPEQVHISEQTCSFLGDNYYLEEGEEVEGNFDFIRIQIYTLLRNCVSQIVKLNLNY